MDNGDAVSVDLLPALIQEPDNLTRHFPARLTVHASLAASLRAHGITEVAPPPYKSGRDAVIVPLVRERKGQVLRISGEATSHSLMEYPEFVLQPLEKWQAGQMRLEIFPLVRTVSPRDPKVADYLRALDKRAEALGYVFWDLNARNIGLLENDAPIVLDPDAVMRKLPATMQDALYKERMGSYRQDKRFWFKISGRTSPMAGHSQ